MDIDTLEFKLLPTFKVNAVVELTVTAVVTPEIGSCGRDKHEQ